MRYENPLYMAEDAGAADIIAGKRLQLGISRGSPEQVIDGWRHFGYVPREGETDDDEYQENALVRWVSRVLPSTPDFHGPHLQALRRSFPSPLRQSAIQASLTALVALVFCMAFYFAIAAPLLSHLLHHRDLREDLAQLRRRSRRARPSLRLWLSMWLAIVGMGILLYWALNGKWSP